MIKSYEDYFVEMHQGISLAFRNKRRCKKFFRKHLKAEIEEVWSD